MIQEIKRFLLVWLIGTIVLMLLPYFLPSFSVSSFVVALIVALILGVADVLVRPLLMRLAHPPLSVFLTEMLFIPFCIIKLNTLLFWAIALFLSGFQVSGFWLTYLGAVVYCLVSWVLPSWILKKRK
ncbi:MAG: phage holin family protein [Burkholderiales bacterium]|jgi:putative membrane protein|nr:phage holin family protein [Burkholderiales bacterium]